MDSQNCQGILSCFIFLLVCSTVILKHWSSSSHLSSATLVLLASFLTPSRKRRDNLDYQWECLLLPINLPSNFGLSAPILKCFSLIFIVCQMKFLPTSEFWILILSVLSGSLHLFSYVGKLIHSFPITSKHTDTFLGERNH